MDDLKIRPYQAGDAGAVAALMNDLETRFGAEAGFTEPEVRDRNGPDAHRWDTDTRLILGTSGELVAMGYIDPPPPGGNKAFVSGGVHPDWRSRGIGRDLFGWQLERLAEMRGDADWEVETGAPELDEQAAHFYARHGFKPVRYFSDMYAALGPVDAAPLPDGLRATEYRADLSRRLYDAHMEAFEDHWGYQRRPYEKWVAYTVESESFRSDLTRVVFDGDQIAGYVMSYDGADGKLYIGQVGTRRPWRRQGYCLGV